MTTKNLIITLGFVAVAGGVGYYLYQKKKTGTAGTPAPVRATQTGGGTGANSSTSPAYNGPINYGSLINGAVDYFTGAGASSGHLPNGKGGATAVAPVNAGSSDGGGDYSSQDSDYNSDEQV